LWEDNLQELEKRTSERNFYGGYLEETIDERNACVQAVQGEKGEEKRLTAETVKPKQPALRGTGERAGRFPNVSYKLATTRGQGMGL